MVDAYLDLLLRLRRAQPAKWAALDPVIKLQALEYEARQREHAELEYEREEETRAA